MVSTIQTREVAKDAADAASSSTSKSTVFGALTPAEIGASAIAAREYGSKRAARAVPGLPARVRVKVDDFDREHAEGYAKVHETFRRRYRTTYGRGYPRSIHADWSALREIVGTHGAVRAELAVVRMFDDELFVGAGIDSVSVAASWASALLRKHVGRDGRRLTRDEQALIRAVIRQHASLLVGGGA